MCVTFGYFIVCEVKTKNMNETSIIVENFDFSYGKSSLHFQR